MYPHTPPRSASPGTPPNESHIYKHTRRNRIRAVLMRAGTSKGLFLLLSDLPSDRAAWGPVIKAAMGSPDKYAKQLDGVGGGVSTQSKVAVVSRSSDPRADVDYLFIQDGGELDFSGNCGNMSSGVGPFAVDEGLVRVPDQSRREVTIRIRNVNTNRIIHSTFEVDEGFPVEEGQMTLDGVSSPGSPIRLDFLDPFGSMTGRLLPTGRPIDRIRIPSLPGGAGASVFTVSCVDAANPFVFVNRAELGIRGDESASEIAVAVTATLMEIRAHAAVLMGLAPTAERARLVMGTPKIALVGPPCDTVTSSGRKIAALESDIWVRPFSMGAPHPAIQMTGAVCVAAASAVPGTLVNMIVKESRLSIGKSMSEPLVIAHGAGTMVTRGYASVRADGTVEVQKGSVYRTARRLMEGYVLYQAASRC